MLVALGGDNAVRSAPSLPDPPVTSAQSGHERTRVDLLTPEQLVKLVSGVLNESLVKEIGGMFQFNITGESGGTWFLDLRSGHGRIYAEKQGDNPDVVLTMSVENMQQIFYGQTTAFDAYMQGALTVDGDLRMAMSLEAIVKKLRQKPLVPDRQVSQRPGVYIV